MREDWQGMLRRLPSDWQEQAIQLKAWQRMRKLACVSDLLRALLVYAACGYSFRQLGLWATLMGLGSLSERAWRKRVERAQEWIRWLLGALIGSQQSPGWLPKTAGRVWLIDASRLKTPAGSGEDVKLHSAYNLCAGRLEYVEVSDRHSGEGLHHFALRKGDVVVTDAGYQLGASIQQGQAQGAYGVHRVSNHQVRLEREDGQKIDLRATDQAPEVRQRERVQGMGLGPQPQRALCRSCGDLAAPSQAGDAGASTQTRTHPAQKGVEGQSGASVVGRGDDPGDHTPTGAVVSPRRGEAVPSALADRTAFQTAQTRLTGASAASQALGTGSSLCPSVLDRVVVAGARSPGAL